MLPPSITDVFAESAYIYIAKILPHNSSVTLLKFRSTKIHYDTVPNTEHGYEYEPGRGGGGGGQKFFECSNLQF